MKLFRVMRSSLFTGGHPYLPAAISGIARLQLGPGAGGPGEVLAVVAVVVVTKDGGGRRGPRNCGRGRRG